MEQQHVCVIGLGYIGLPTASILASQGFHVTGVDVDAYVVDTINQAQVHIKERDLDVLVRAAVQSKRLKASLTVVAADIFIIAVPTPFKQNHKPDLCYIEQACNAIVPVLTSGNLVILESTSPVGTTEQIANWLQKKRTDLTFPGFDNHAQQEQVYLAHCPERVLPGHILRELVENDRIIGGLDQASSLKAKKLYETFTQGKIVLTDACTAEMAKLTENAFRDVNIAFANELANICDRLDINVWELISLANHHPRVNILQPGPGVGGHCIAVDPWFIIDSAPMDTALLKAARHVNDDRPNKIMAKINTALMSKPNAVIACLGLSFKANVGDLRESPAIKIVSALAQRVKNTILVVEPFISTLPESLQAQHINLVELDLALATADIIVILVKHDLFKDIKCFSLQNKIVIDSIGLSFIA